MKSYTDIEQSKKLAEILPLESADMYYFTIIRDYPYSQGKIKTIAKIMDGSFSSNYDTPCWSLAALLGVIPEGIIENYYVPNLQKENSKYSIAYGNDELLCIADNPVDACYEMVLKLHELNLL